MVCKLWLKHSWLEEMMFEAWDENVQQEQQEQEGEQDHASFDDSDRFEDESICSFETESSSNNNWQGWKKPPPPTGSGPSPQPLRTLMSISGKLTHRNFSILH